MLDEAEIAAWGLLVVLQEIKARIGVAPVEEVRPPAGI